jgi:hypothetical protein
MTIMTKKKNAALKRGLHCTWRSRSWRRASNRYGVRLPQDFTVALGHYEVEDTDPEVEES